MASYSVFMMGPKRVINKLALIIQVKQVVPVILRFN